MIDLTDVQLDRLATAAVSARDNAYAPYSDFLMGAAVLGRRRRLDEDDVIVSGVLVENVSLGLAMCAERVALFSSVTNGVEPLALALCAKRTEGELTFPCGACLQVALELADEKLVILAIDPEGNREQVRLGSLLKRAPKRHTPTY